MKKISIDFFQNYLDSYKIDDLRFNLIMGTNTDNLNQNDFNEDVLRRIKYTRKGIYKYRIMRYMNQQANQQNPKVYERYKRKHTQKTKRDARDNKHKRYGDACNRMFFHLFATYIYLRKAKKERKHKH